ncbi:MAG TPA: L-threonine 3-dehydrogenase [Caulobacteraceae bacterium]|nr:L-threonine 3-dehydrogenase [Caulobacteraceae bacterium]
MTHSMTGLAKLEPKEGLWMTRAPIPKPGPEDVLIEIGRSAICGTDLHIYRWDDWAQRTIPVPMIVGHEFSGEIVEIGSRVTRPLKLGQRVSGEGHIINPHSAASRAGRFHLDPDTMGVGVNRQGAFAEYLCLPAFNVAVLPEDVSDDVGALLDPFGNAMHAAQQFDLLGEDVLVTGAGPIGVMAAAIARRAGARSVVITDINDYRLKLATRLADVRPVNVAKEELACVMAREGVENGFGVALEMSGAPEAFDQAVDALAMGGRLALLGLPAGAMEVSWSRIILKALTIKGVYGREMFETWRKMFGLIHAGFDLERLITHRACARDFQTGFDAALSGDAGKVVLNWR